MSARSDRIKQGNAARERVLSGMYNQPTVEVQPQGNRRSMAVRSYQQQEEQRTKQILSAAPEITSNGGLDILKNSPWFKQPIVSEPVTTTPTRIPTSVQRLVNQENKLEQQAQPIPISQREYNQMKRDESDPSNPFWKAVKDNTVDAAADFLDKLRYETKPGQFVDRLGYSAASMVGPTAVPQPTTGVKAADVAADILGGIGGFAVNPGALEQNLMTNTYNIANKALLTKGGQVAQNAISKGLTKANPLLNAQSLNIGANTANKVAEHLVRGGIAGAQQNVMLDLARGEGDVKNLAKSALVGAAFGGAGDAALSGLGSVFSRMLKRNNIPDEQVQEILALPLGREDAARLRRQQQSGFNDVITPDYYPEPLGLPSPKMGNPTTARVSRQTNPYRQQFESLMSRAQQLQSEGKFTPGREDLELESLWGQMAGREGVSLDELIQRAYPSRSNRIEPDLVQRAQQYQRSREVAGVPLPVKSQSDLYKSGQLGIPEDIVSTVKVTGKTPNVGSSSINRQMVELSPEQAAQEAFNRIPSNRSRTVTRIKEEVPATPERTTVDAQPNERGFIANMRSSQTTTPEVMQGLESSAKRTYTPITNAETVQRANNLIDTKGVDAVEANLLSKRRFNADDVAQGMRVIQELQSSGNINRAVTMAEKLASKLTEAGQTVQAASIWNRLSPEGALLAAQRKVNKINEDLLKGQTPAKVSEKQANDIISSAQTIQASGASKERAGQVIDIADRLKKGETISPSEKKIITDFVTDLKTFVKPARPPKNTSLPKEFKDTRVRDRVVEFMDKQEQAALERIKARRGRLSSTPFDEWADYALVGASRLAKGAVKFSDWSASMITDFGDEIKPHLAKLFQRSQEELTQNSKKITEQVVSRAENIAEKYLKKNESTISVEDADFIRNMARNVSSLSGDAQRLASQDLQEIMNGFEKAGVGRKISSAQYISMLLNPKTQIRNIVGNELMYRIERIARLIGTPIDIVASKVSGGPRQITFKSGPSIFDDFFTPSKDYFTKLPEGFRAGARGVSPEGLQSKYEIQGPAFRSKYNPLTYLEKALGASLQGFDYAAYTRATNQRMREMAYLDAINKGIKGNDAIRDYMQTYMANLDDATHAIARDYGKFSTLQNDSGLASKLMGFRRGVNQLTAGNKDFGVGSLVLPFAKTPANLLLRGIDYSPLGILKALKQTGDIILKKNTDLTRADVIDSVSRSLMGTGMGAVAYWLADKGAMFGQTNADPEVRKLQQLSGIKDFQINGSALKRMLQAITSGGDVDAAAKIQPGDTLWSYEWAQPTSMPLAIGSNIYQGVKEKKGAARTTGEAALSGLNTLLESSVLSGIQEAFKVPTGEDNAVKAIAMNLIKQVPSMATPSLVRNINTYLDNTVKETYDPDTATSIINPARSNIPGLSQQLPQRVDTLGKPQTKPNSFFDVFVSPADRSKYNPTKEAQLVIDLIKETGNNNLAPRAVAKYITGKDSNTGESRKVDLTPEQYVRLQTIVGQETNKRLGQIDNNLPTDKKVELALKALTDAGKIGRNELKRELGISPTK